MIANECPFESTVRMGVWLRNGGSRYGSHAHYAGIRIGLSILLTITACSRDGLPAARSGDSTDQNQVGHRVVDSFTAPPDSPLVLFQVEASNDQYFLHPIALINGDQLVQPKVGDMNDSAANVFRQTYYGRGQEFRLLGGGEELGVAVAGAAVDPGCFGLEANAQLRLVHPASTDQALFATNAARIGRKTFVRRLLEGEDRETLYRHISQILADSGVPPALRSHSFMIAGSRIEVAGANPFIIGALRVDSTENGGGRVIAVLLGMDSTPSGYRQTLLTYHNGLEADAEVERFIDALEIDGASPPELITRTVFYESFMYTVYRKGPSGWQPWYSGGGGGC